MHVDVNDNLKAIIRLSKAKRKLYIDGSTINRENYENFDLEENELAINSDTNKLYALGTDVQSEKSNLYIIEISL